MVTQHRAAVLLAEAQVALEQHVVEGVPEDGQAEMSVEGVPVDVEPVRERGVAAVPSTSHSGAFAHSGATSAMWLGTMSTTMPRRVAAVAASRSARRPAELRLTRVWSSTSYPCIEPGTACRTGREVEVADAQVPEVRNDRLGVREGEPGVQLQSVGRRHGRAPTRLAGPRHPGDGAGAFSRVPWRTVTPPGRQPRGRARFPGYPGKRASGEGSPVRERSPARPRSWCPRRGPCARRCRRAARGASGGSTRAGTGRR